MRARINDIPAEQGPTWGAVAAVLRFDNRTGWKMHWTSLHPATGKQFSVIDIEVPGEDVDALRAEIEEAVGIVNDIAARDPMKTMVRADIGLAEFYLE
jgi:hypothetical protein